MSKVIACSNPELGNGECARNSAAGPDRTVVTGRRATAAAPALPPSLCIRSRAVPRGGFFLLELPLDNRRRPGPRTRWRR